MSRLARIINPIVWRLPGRASRKLFAFALAEQSSMVDLLDAANATPSPQRAALYVRHANDEARHAGVFARRSAELRRARGQTPLGYPWADTEQLFMRLGEQAFLAFVHLGEHRGRRQFETYIDYFGAIGAEDDRAMFAGIAADERRHESYTYELLVSMCGNEAEAKKAIGRARRWRAWRAWRRAGRRLAGTLHWGLMVALYLAVAPLALSIRLFKSVPGGWRQLP